MVYSDTGMEYINSAADDHVVFVSDNFEGDIYQRLNRHGCRIFAPPVILKCANDEKVRCYGFVFTLVTLT